VGYLCPATRPYAAQAKRAAVLEGSIFSPAAVAAGKRQLAAAAAAKAGRQRAAAQAAEQGLRTLERTPFAPAVLRNFQQFSVPRW
jgi:hypothetical protein